MSEMNMNTTEWMVVKMNNRMQKEFETFREKYGIPEEELDALFARYHADVLRVFLLNIQTEVKDMVQDMVDELECE